MYCRIIDLTLMTTVFLPICVCTMPLSYRPSKVVDSTELCAYLNGASLKIDSPIIMTNPNYYEKPHLFWQTPIIMIPTLIMTPKIRFRPIMVITFVIFCILFTILIVNTELEHYPLIINVMLYWSYLFMKKKYLILMKKTKFHDKDVLRSGVPGPGFH